MFLFRVFWDLDTPILWYSQGTVGVQYLLSTLFVAMWAVVTFQWRNWQIMEGVLLLLLMSTFHWSCFFPYSAPWSRNKNTVYVRPLEKLQHSCLLLTSLAYCHILRVFVTYKTGFGFDDRIYWTFIELVITFHKSLSSTGRYRPDHTALNDSSAISGARVTHCYIASGLTSRKTSPLLSNGCPIFLRIRWNVFT
jgi:hypothetical protein